jgi:Ca-activated chloride channel homolog
MLSKMSRYLTVVGLACLLVFVGVAGDFAWAMPRSAPTSGPDPLEEVAIPQQQGPSQQPGEGVIVPKKQAPPPVQPKTPEKINPNNVYSISTQSNMVNVNVLVEDANGDPIPNLQKVNFKLYDDGVQQAVTNFAAVKAPMTVCMLVEFSNEYWTLLYQALESAFTFLNFMQPKDWVAVVSFDLKPRILTDFTHNRMEVEAGLRTLVFPGFSEDNLYDALAFCIDRMKNIQGRKAILALVSGFDSMSKLTYSQMLKVAKASSTPIYAVSILEWTAVRMPGGYNSSYWVARNGLNYITKYSGGQAYFPRFEGELPGDYRQIANQLRSQYSIGFAPTDPTLNGKYHKLKIELVDAGGNPLRIVNQKGKKVKYSLVYRDGYYAQQNQQ